jgi:leucyl/phenylalanyl-tRNA---protein transferase
VDVKPNVPRELPLDALRAAYRDGWFPMGERGSRRLEWFSPDPRGILPLDGLHVPARLRRTLRSHRFEIRVDTAFAAVMRACAERDDTWISDVILESYQALHRTGEAHSVECWREGRLAGGLYGVAQGGAFFGESMFHVETDASKVALVALVDRLNERGFQLLDLQWVTPHLAQFGAVEIRRRDYLRELTRAIARDCHFV